MLVQRRREHDAQVALVQRLRRAAQDGAEVRIGDQWQREADHPGAAARQAARTAVRREAVLPHDLQHRLARLGGDVWAVVEDARDGGDRNAGQVRDVADRRPPAEGRIGLGVGLSHAALY